MRRSSRTRPTLSTCCRFHKTAARAGRVPGGCSSYYIDVQKALCFPLRIDHCSLRN